MKKVSLNLGRFTCRLTHTHATFALIFISSRLRSNLVRVSITSPGFIRRLNSTDHNFSLPLELSVYFFLQSARCIIATGMLGLSVPDLYKQREMKRLLRISYYLNKRSLKNMCSCSWKGKNKNKGMMSRGQSGVTLDISPDAIKAVLRGRSTIYLISKVKMLMRERESLSVDHHLIAALPFSSPSPSLPTSALMNQFSRISGALDSSHSPQNPCVNFCPSRSWETAHLQALPGIISLHRIHGLFKSQQEAVRWVKAGGRRRHRSSWLVWGPNKIVIFNSGQVLLLLTLQIFFFFFFFFFSPRFQVDSPFLPLTLALGHYWSALCRRHAR